MAQSELTSREDFQPSGERSLDVRERMKKSLEVSPLDKGPLELFVAAIGKLVSEKPTLSLCQISSGTIEFDMDEVPSACEPKLTKTSLSNLLNERFVLLLKYLNRKMVKYSVSVSLAGSYVELVRRRTKSKATTTAKVTERIAILTSECATLQEREEQLRAK